MFGSKLLSIVLFLVVVMGGFVFAGECGSVPTDGCYISTDTTFDPGTYYLPNGVSIFRTNNITLDCNGAILVGPGGSDAISGIYVFSAPYTTIRNCVIQDYPTGIQITFGSSNSNVFDNTISGGLYSMGIYQADAVTVIGNTVMSATTGITLLSSDNPKIEQNQIYGHSFTGIEVTSACVNTIVRNNNLYNNYYNILLFEEPTNPDAEYNWWGTTNETEIEEKIFDYYDDSTVGIVDYYPYLCEAYPTSDYAPCESCSCGTWQNQGCGIGGCASDMLYQTRSCTPSGCDDESQCVSDISCTLECTPGTTCCDSTGHYRPYGYDCGTCQACNGAGSCSVTPSDDSDCGIISCDDWHHILGSPSPLFENYCYDSPDIISSRCEGFGNCKDVNTADCGSDEDTLELSCGECRYVSGCSGTVDGYCINYAQGISCGDNMECDGSGNCVSILTCDNGIKDGDETGVDCGGYCPNQDCCTNSYQDTNLGEEGVDCGGNCPVCEPKYVYLWLPVSYWRDLHQFQSEAEKRADFFMDISPLYECKSDVFNVYVDPGWVQLNCGKNSGRDITNLEYKNATELLDNIFGCTLFYEKQNGVWSDRVIGFSQVPIGSLMHPPFSGVARMGGKVVYSEIKAENASFDNTKRLEIPAHELGHAYYLCDESDYLTWLDENFYIRCPNRWSSTVCNLSGISDECYGIEGKCCGALSYRNYSGPYTAEGTKCEGITYSILGSSVSEHRCGYSEESYNHLKDFLNCSFIPMFGKVERIILKISKDNGIVLDEVFVGRGKIPVYFPMNSSYKAIFSDKYNESIKELNLTPSFYIVSDGSIIEINETLVEIKIPFPDVWHSLTVKYNESPIFEVNISDIICNNNSICEENENYFSCLDCSSGSADGICDKVNDGICDPDCALGVDPDCIAYISNCTTINESGTYYLIENITDSIQNYCIDIVADNVVLDCQGHTIDGDVSWSIRVQRGSPTDTNVVIKNCIITGWSGAFAMGNANNNLFYNNLVNTTYHVGITAPFESNWNIIKTPGKNIIGGDYLGGNFWTHPQGAGFSEACFDGDNDGICNSSYALIYGGVDNLPLTHVGNAGAEIDHCMEFKDPGTYYLVEDILNSESETCIEIQRPDTTLDCRGHLIDGENMNGRYGVSTTSNSRRFTLRNCTLTDWRVNAVKIWYSDNTTIEDIEIHSCKGDGISIDRSDKVLIEDASIHNNEQGGINLKDSTNTNVIDSMIYNNKVDIIPGSYCNHNISNVVGTDGKPIVFINETVNLFNWNNNVSQIILCDADNSVLSNITIQHFDRKSNGIYLINTDNAILTNISVLDSQYGLYLDNSGFNTILDSTFDGNERGGIYLKHSNNNTIQDISVNNCGYAGVEFFLSDSNKLTDCFLKNVVQGALIVQSQDNILTGCHFENNSWASIHTASYAFPSDSMVEYNWIYNNLFNNTIYHDYFPFGGLVPPGFNYWNTSLTAGKNIVGGGYLGGNYYTNPIGNGFSDTCSDSDRNGICDNSFEIIDKNVDYLPLTNYHILGIEFNILLSKGWNLLSIPLNLTNNTLTEAFKSIEGNYSHIFVYVGGRWYSHYTNDTKTNKSAEPKIGFWINMINDDVLELEGTEFNYPLSFSLKEGWNLIGYPVLNETLINETFNISKISSVMMYNNSKWYSYNPLKPTYRNTLKYFIPGYGYWVKANENSTLVIS